MYTLLRIHSVAEAVTGPPLEPVISIYSNAKASEN